MNAYRNSGTTYATADYNTVNYNTSQSAQYQKCYNACMRGYDYPFPSTSGYNLDRACPYGAICRMNPLRGSDYRRPYSRGDFRYRDVDKPVSKCGHANPGDPQPSTECAQKAWTLNQSKWPANVGQNCAYKCSPGRLDLNPPSDVCDWCYKKCEGNMECMNISCPGCTVPKTDMLGEYPGLYYPRLH